MRSVEEIAYITNNVLPIIDQIKYRRHLKRWKDGRCCYYNTRGRCKEKAIEFSIFCKGHIPKKIAKGLTKKEPTTTAVDQGSFDRQDMADLNSILSDIFGFERNPSKYTHNPNRMVTTIIEHMLTENPALDEDEVIKYVTKFVNDPVEYIHKMTNIRLYEYQRPFFNEIINLPKGKSDTISGLFVRQVGKNETIGCGAVELLTKYDGFQIGLFAPTEKQAKAIGLERVRQRLRSNPVLSAMIVRDKDDFILLNNGSSIRAFTANKNSQIEGFTLHLAIIDESQDVDDHIVSHDIMPMLAGVGGSSVKIGTAGSKGHFYRTCKNNISRRNRHFQYNWKEVAKERPEYRMFVEAMIDELGGEDSEEFKSQFMNEWILAGSAFISDAKLTRLVRQDFIPETEPLPNAVYVAGLDVAKIRDRTVLTIMRVGYLEELKTKHIVKWYAWFGDDYITQMEEVAEICHHWGISLLGVDSTKEDSFADLLEIEKGLPVIRIKMTLGSKSDIYKSYIYDINRMTIFVSECGDEYTKHRKRWFTETSALEKEWMTGSVMKIWHPEGEQYHDDYPDSTAIAGFIAREVTPLSSIIEMNENEIYQRDLVELPKRFFVDEENEYGKIIKKIQERTDWNRIF